MPNKGRFEIVRQLSQRTTYTVMWRKTEWLLHNDETSTVYIVF